MRSFFLLNFIVVTSGCSRENAQSSQNISVFIDVSKGIDLNFTDVFETVSIIPLETSDEILIGSVDDLLFSDGYIFVLDGKKAQSVFIFTNEGKFHKVIKSTGMGPGELDYPSNIAIDSEKQLLFIQDSKQGKVIVYDFEGNYIKEIRNLQTQSTFDFFYLVDRIYVFDGFANEIFEKIKILDTNFNEISSIHTYSDLIPSIRNGKKSKYFYENSQGSGLFYKEMLSNVIFEIVRDSVVSTYEFAFSERGLYQNKMNIRHLNL